MWVTSECQTRKQVHLSTEHSGQPLGWICFAPMSNEMGAVPGEHNRVLSRTGLEKQARVTHVELPVTPWPQLEK